MIRSAKAIDRFLIILTLAWFWFTWEAGAVLPFSVGIRRYRGTLSIFEFAHLEYIREMYTGYTQKVIGSANFHGAAGMCAELVHIHRVCYL